MARRPPSLNSRSPTPGPRKSWETTRTSRHARGYGWDWEKKRAALLKREPICRACRSRGRAVVATDVDHILDKALGGSDDEDNLQPLCGPCHKAKTAQAPRTARD